MTFTANIITALITGGVSFLLGWVVCKAVLAQQAKLPGNEAETEDDIAIAKAMPVSADVAELQAEIRSLQEDQAELNAKNSRYEDRINEQVRMLANLQEDRDRIRVEHGSQKRLIQTLQQTSLNKDEARQSVAKQQQAYEEHIYSLEKQLASLEKTNGTAPVPSMMGEADGISLRDQLIASKASESSLTSQLQALQEWARPLATENTEQAELIDRLKHQVGALRSEQQAAQTKLNKLSAAISKAKLAQRQRATEVEATGTHALLTASAGSTDSVVSPTAAETETGYDSLEETHTDLQPADDLKKIRGIGPGLERKFNAAGIFSYAQLAELNKHQLQKIATRTKKAHRASWANEARRLHESGNA